MTRLEAKAVARDLLHDLGWAEGAIEDLGGIETAAGPEAFMLFVPPIVRRHGMAPFALAISR